MRRFVERYYAVALPGKSVSMHPTLQWADEGGREGWIFYGFSANWGHVQEGRTPHVLVSRKISFDAR